jgi:hypothetical protein
MFRATLIGMPLDAWKYRELGSRVAALESAAKKPAPPPPKKGPWDVASLLMPLMNGVAIALVGWWLTGAVELALKRDTLQLAQVKEMQALITGLTSDKLDAETALPTALTLAAFGKPAVPPLLALLTERFDEVRGPAAESALRAIGMANREALCEPLVVLGRARAGRLSWPVHATVIRLIGDVQCDKAAAQLRAIDRRLASADVAALAAEYDSRPVFDRNSVLELRKTIAASLRSLEPAR